MILLWLDMLLLTQNLDISDSNSYLTNFQILLEIFKIQKTITSLSDLFSLLIGLKNYFVHGEVVCLQLPTTISCCVLSFSKKKPFVSRIV